MDRTHPGKRAIVLCSIVAAGLFSARCGSSTSSRGGEDAANLEGGAGGGDDSGLDAASSGPVDAVATDASSTSDSGIQQVDGAAGPSCPRQPPTHGAACDAVLACAYVDCASYGHVSADCNGTAWTVQGTSCDPDAGWVACRDDVGSPLQMTCASDEVCRVYYSGAVIVTCVKNTCPPGLLSCECLDCASFGCHVTDSELLCGGGCSTCL